MDIETVKPGSTVPATRPAQPADEMMSVIERVASNPDADITKLERLIDLKRSIDADRARTAFNTAFAAMQGKLPVIDERGAIKVDGAVRSRYAKYEDIQAAIRPVLMEFGFSIRHRNEVLQNGQLKIVGILSHREGHSEQDEFICPPDTGGGKPGIQAIGSTRSYGMRYTTIALLNIETRGLDDDGQRSEEKQAPAAPDGFEKFWNGLEYVAPEGMARLTEIFNAAAKPLQQYLLQHHARDWAALKNKAQKAGRK